LPPSPARLATVSVIGPRLGRGGAEVRWSVAGRMAIAWVITLPAAGLVGAVCWALAHFIGGATGVIVVFAILLTMAGWMWNRSRRHAVTPDNVNADRSTDTTPADSPDATTTAHLDGNESASMEW